MESDTSPSTAQQQSFTPINVDPHTRNLSEDKQQIIIDPKLANKNEKPIIKELPISRLGRPGVKQHGFQCPFHPLQILSYFIFFWDLTTFFCINMVSVAHESSMLACLSVLYSIVSILVVYYCIKATKTDPSDPTIYAQRQAEHLGQPFDSSKYDYECEVCQTHVLDNSKHCGACNRCVNSFDHHCRWLNNCVGKKNYNYFFKLICLFLAMTIIHNIVNVIVFFYFATDNEFTEQSNINVFAQFLELEFTVLLGVSCFFNLGTLIFLGHLVYFHIYLIRKGMTTFEYIRWKQNRTKASKIVKRKEDKSQKSTSVTAAASDLVEQKVLENDDFEKKHQRKDDIIKSLEDDENNITVVPQHPNNQADQSKDATQSISQQLKQINNLKESRKQAKGYRTYTCFGRQSRSQSSMSSGTNSGNNILVVEQPDMVRTSQISNDLNADNPQNLSANKNKENDVIIDSPKSKDQHLLQMPAELETIAQRESSEQKKNEVDNREFELSSTKNLATDQRIQDQNMNLTQQIPQSDRKLLIVNTNSTNKNSSNNNPHISEETKLPALANKRQVQVSEFIANEEPIVEVTKSPLKVSGSRNRMQQILTIGAGDDQSHVSRPRTASVAMKYQNVKPINKSSNQNLSQAVKVLKRVNSQLETINENDNMPRDSEGDIESNGKFDIDESYSFSLRNYHNKGSQRNLKELNINCNSGMSLYSKKGGPIRPDSSVSRNSKNNIGLQQHNQYNYQGSEAATYNHPNNINIQGSVNLDSSFGSHNVAQSEGAKLVYPTMDHNALHKEQKKQPANNVIQVRPKPVTGSKRAQHMEKYAVNDNKADIQTVNQKNGVQIGMQNLKPKFNIKNDEIKSDKHYTPQQHHSKANKFSNHGNYYAQQNLSNQQLHQNMHQQMVNHQTFINHTGSQEEIRNSVRKMKKRQAAPQSLQHVNMQHRASNNSHSHFWQSMNMDEISQSNAFMPEIAESVMSADEDDDEHIPPLQVSQQIINHETQQSNRMMDTEENYHKMASTMNGQQMISQQTDLLLSQQPPITKKPPEFISENQNNVVTNHQIMPFQPRGQFHQVQSIGLSQGNSQVLETSEIESQSIILKENANSSVSANNQNNNNSAQKQPQNQSFLHF